MGQHRPNPDELLSALAAKPEGRGHLKVFLGAAAGVGKTYAMLSEAREQQARGVDVLNAYVETHGRAETEALLDGLPSIPLAELAYRGAVLRELDVDAILAKRPGLTLIDELAHTNAPGSRHAKRWQDIDEILGSGLDVYTAVNIQHLESLNDVVAQITGVRVQETVPDSFLESADEIELIDLPPGELQQRLKEGRIYVPERAEQALQGFFKSSNLTALRELALRRAADQVDAEMRRLRLQEGARAPWAARERILVCIAPNRMALRVVRSAARMGAASHGELIAVHVESERQSSRSQEDRATAESALALAEKLGMEVVHLSGQDIAGEVINFAERRNATLIVVGRPIRPRWREVLFGSVVDDIVRMSGDVDVHVITAEPEAPPRRQAPRSQGARITPGGLAVVAATVGVATALSSALFARFGETNVAMIYLVGVAIAALRCTRVESMLGATLSVLAFDFFFVHPILTFSVSDARYLLVFVVMLAVAVVISDLTHRLRDQVRATCERERRAASLYSLSRRLAVGRGKREMAQAAAKEIRDVFDGDVAVWLLDEGGRHLIAPSTSGFEQVANEDAVAAWVGEHASPAGLGTDTLPGAKALYLPLEGADSTIGVMAFLPHGAPGGAGLRQLLDTFANSLGLALERAVLAKRSNQARIAAEAERVRSTLLSSISHDLRTPLTTITGSASSLVEGAGDPQSLGRSIYDQSVRLNHQIQNLLDMTRLQSGSVELNLQWHSIGELIASALRTARPSLGDRTVAVEAQGDLPLLRVDGLLIEKALVNLLENAGRHTEPSDAVRVAARAEGASIIVLVEDTGPGLPPEDLLAVFRTGYRKPTGGHGLGLAVVRAIIELHAGAVSVGNRLEGGASFRIELPLPDHQPEAPRD